MPTVKIAATAVAVFLVPVVLIAAAAGGVAAMFTANGSTVEYTPSGSASMNLPGHDADQMANAATIVAVGEQMTAPEQG